MTKSYIFIFTIASLSAIVGLFSCTGCNENKQVQQVSYQTIEEDLIEMNIRITENEERLIDSLASARGWELLVSNTGLRYAIDTSGQGGLAEPGRFVSFTYNIELMDGTPCYNSQDDGVLSFTVGQDDVVRGLHEAAQLMRKGDQAQLILPSRLGYGFTGDQNKIPGNSILLYELEMIDLQ